MLFIHHLIGKSYQHLGKEIPPAPVLSPKSKPRLPNIFIMRIPVQLQPAPSILYNFASSC